MNTIKVATLMMLVLLIGMQAWGSADTEEWKAGRDTILRAIDNAIRDQHLAGLRRLLNEPLYRDIAMSDERILQYAEGQVEDFEEEVRKNRGGFEEKLDVIHAKEIVNLLQKARMGG